MLGRNRGNRRDTWRDRRTWDAHIPCYTSQAEHHLGNDSRIRVHDGRSVTDINLAVVGNPEVASIMVRGSADPDSLDYEEAYRYTWLMRCYMNQGLKQLRLFEKGALSSRDWENAARELAYGFSSPGGKRFREGNHFFEDLYAEMDKYESGAVSDWALGKEESQ